MSFRWKILAAMALAGVAPLLVLGWLSYRTNRQELTAVVGRLQTRNAQELSRYVERFVGNAVANLQLTASYIPFDQLHGEELAAVLAIPYRQLPYVNVVALLDETGDAIVPPLSEANPERHPELAGHEPIGEADLERFASRVPLQAALESGVAIGPPYPSASGRAARVAVAVRIRSDARRVLAAELSLEEVRARLAEIARAGDAAWLVDGRGALLAHGSGAGQLEESEARLVRAGLTARAPSVEELSRGGEPWLAAFAPVEQLGWGIAVAQRSSQAFRAAERVRTQTLAWALLAAGLTAALGAVLARGLARPVAALSEVARAATAGVYDTTAQVGGRDEIGQFGQAFNHMMGEIKRRDAEIRGWNQELQQRVEQRTAELKAAQDQILRTRRLAAIGTLGAGVAHELNNPLTSIIGMVTVAKKGLAADSPQAQPLDTALEQAKRAAKIVAELRQFASREQEEAGKRFKLAPAIEAALQGVQPQLAGGRIEVSRKFGDGLPEVQGDPAQIQQLVTNLLQNAVTAMPEGGKLEVGLGAVEGEAIKLWVSDTGKGIPKELRERIFDPFFSTKDRPSQLGLGLTLCHSIAEAHHGSIQVESVPGQGSTFTVILPAAAPGGHLY